MNRSTISGIAQPCCMPPAQRLLAAAVGVFGLAVATYLEAGTIAATPLALAAAVPGAVPSFPAVTLASQLSACAHVLLVAATVLYVAHLWATARVFGLWASALAMAGACGLVGALLAHARELLGKMPGVAPMFSSLAEVMSLFCALTVIVYLAMEWAYRTRAAGAFVMPVVAAASLLQAWLGNNEHALRGHPELLRSYWLAAHALSSYIAYGAFAAAGALGALFLVRAERAAGLVPAGAAFAPAALERMMQQAVLVGFALFSFAAVSGSVAAGAQWERWAWSPKESGALLLWINYGAYLYACHARQWRGARAAWWCIAGCALTLLCFVAAHRYPAVLHA
ncbi:MAG: cytochrome c biogenesis protein CcsA [Pseudomonadota bacterium]